MPRARDDLKAATTTLIQSISSQQLLAVFRNKLKRVRLCLDANGMPYSASNVINVM